MTRRGFTLVEVMVVVVVASLLGLAVAGTVSMALDTRQRVEARRLQVRSELAWRSLVLDVFRNARQPVIRGDSALLLLDGVAPNGTPADRVVLVTAGSFPPLSAGTDWLVSLAAGDGVRLTAAPVGVAAVPVVVEAPASVTGLDVVVMGPDGEWRGVWETTWTLPAAVRITFRGTEGALDPPVTVRLPDLEAPQ